ncbi:MAG: hypothetical protein P8J33_15590 [Pirellulaceae bacterium]|nr:hypothetical protein [Pirellulaceae bacterium]
MHDVHLEQCHKTRRLRARKRQPKNLAVAWLCLLAMVFSVATAQADLTKNQIKILETEFWPAWNIGNTQGVLESLNRAVRSMDAIQLKELDELLADREIPPSSQLLLESRLMLLRQGLGKKLPRPGQQEMLSTLGFIYGDVSSQLDSAHLLSDSLDLVTENTAFDRFEILLWETHVTTQKLESSLRLANYAADLLKKSKRTKWKKLDAEQKELITHDFAATVEELETLKSNLREHEVVARIKRLTHARNILANDESERKSQFLAAWSASQDSLVIQEALQAAGKKVNFKHPLLQDEDLQEDVGRLAERAKEMASEELLVKSRLLFEGMHWWYRGRYGMGTDGYGLLKSPAAVRDDAAYFALLMPEEPPTPTRPDVSKHAQIPEFDRRHDYIWAWEYRTLEQFDERVQHRHDSQVEITQQTKLSRFY